MAAVGNFNTMLQERNVLTDLAVSHWISQCLYTPNDWKIKEKIENL